MAGVRLRLRAVGNLVMFDNILLAGSTGMADVFVSYGREDKDRIKPIVEALTRFGLSVWSDARIGAGAHWDEVIEKELDEAKAILVCWSAESVKSPWVKSEAGKGQLGEKLVPCLLEACKIPLQFQFDQAEDISNWNGAAEHPGWRKILERIGGLVQRPGLAGLLDAQAAGDDRRLLAWAQEFPGDPLAKSAFDLVGANERARFDAELSAARDALAGAMAKLEGTLLDSLRDCSNAFDNWVGNIATAPYAERPAIGPRLEAFQKSLATEAMRAIEAERDKAREEARQLKTVSDAALVEKETLAKKIPSPLRRWGPLLIGVVLAGAAGAFGREHFAGSSDKDEGLLSRLGAAEAEREKARSESEDLKRRISDLTTQLEAAAKAGEEEVAARRDAERQLENRSKETEIARSRGDGEARTLKETLAARDKEITSLNQELGASNKEKEQLRGRLAALLEGKNERATEGNLAAPRPQPSSSSLDGVANSNSTAKFSVPNVNWKAAETGKCQISFGGREIFAGKCTYMQGDERYFYFKTVGGTGRSYQAYWQRRNAAGDGAIAQGRWNGPEANSDSDLGTMRPVRGCWVNADLRFCVLSRR